MGMFDSLFGGGGGSEYKVDEWTKSTAGLGLTGLGSAFFGDQWIPNYSQKDMQANQQIISRENLVPYGQYPVEDRFAATPDQFTTAADYSMYMRDPNEAGIGRAMQLYNRGANFDPSRIDDYENAYTGGMIDEIYRIGAERLGEDLLPRVNTTFTGAGQFGSSRHEDFTNRAIRDTQREALGQVRGILYDSRSDAMDQYAAERGRDLEAGRGFAQLPGQASMADTNYINNLLRTGEMMRMEDQRPLDFEYDQWMRNENQIFDFINAWTGTPAAQPQGGMRTEGSTGGVLGALGGLAAAGVGAYAMGGG